MFELRPVLFNWCAALIFCAGCLASGAETQTPGDAPKPAVTEPKPEPFEAITKAQIDAITYEDCEDDEGVTFPFASDFTRVTDNEDSKKSFDEWRDQLDKWDCSKETRLGQKVRNFISLMALIDVMQLEFERETPLVLLNRMTKEIPKEQLLKAVAYCALKPEEGTIMDKAPELGIEDGASEDRVRERVSVYAKKVLGRLLGKLPPKSEEAKK